MAVGAEHDEDVVEGVEQHHLRRDAHHLRKRVVQLGVPRVKPDLRSNKRKVNPVQQWIFQFC